MSSSSQSKMGSSDTFNILVATDCHLGYEFSKRRGHEEDDSFNTFEEILQIGQDNKVDFILLGGDLFHDAKPSQRVMIKCMELLRKYCLGTKENEFQFLSDPEIIFDHCANKTLNFEDPNLNVSIPVFSIHGNHDDPSFAAVGSMDLLSVSGLVNYFGKWTDLTKITIPPLVMRKGNTYLCLYGLSYINDQRLSRLLRDHKVEMLRPEGIPEPFNMFVLHQNRVPHGEYAHIPDNKLPDFLNLIIWGHEHECRITPEYVADSEYFICQPGSPVATSLCEAESQPKHVGILSIRGTQFKLKKIKLRTVRPFVFDDVFLQNRMEIKDSSKALSEYVYNFIANRIETELIPKAATMISDHPKQPKKPLFRIRVHYTKEEQIFDPIRLGQKYVDDIANPTDMIVFRKDKGEKIKRKDRKHKAETDADDMAQIFDYDGGDKDWCKTIPGGIKNFFDKEENRDKLTVLSINGLNGALNAFVDKGNPEAFREIIQHQMQKTIKYLMDCEVETKEEMLGEIANFRNKRREKAQEQEEVHEITQVFSHLSKKTQKAPEPQRHHSLLGSDDENVEEDSDIRETAVAKTRGKASRGRGTRGTRGARGGRGRAKAEEKKISSTAKDQSSIQRFMIGQSGQSRQSKKVPTCFIDDSD